MSDEGGLEVRVRVRIGHETDVPVARQRVRALASVAGLPTTAVEALATAVSEVARNIAIHAGGGEVLAGVLGDGHKRGIVVIARDWGPGIPDLDLAMEDGYSTAGGLGFGLPGARRLVDEFEIESSPNAGTRIIMRKWKDGDP